eukprot:m.111087 g.111087  ORF g.111087 m.111087 type:complete len:195 (+) comp16990_c0_seq16:205-789(+)
MSFLESLLASMDAPPKRDPAVVAAAKARQDMAKRAAKEEREREEKFEAMITTEVEAFVNGPATIKKFDPMPSDKREILHRMAAKRGVITYAFGEEDVDRRVVCFKSAVAPIAAHVQLMDRSLPYQACMDDLEKKLKENAAADAAAKKETETKKGAKKAPIVIFTRSHAILCTLSNLMFGEYGNDVRIQSHNSVP